MKIIISYIKGIISGLKGKDFQIGFKRLSRPIYNNIVDYSKIRTKEKSRALFTGGKI
jgi:hypothetical protein